MWNVLKAYCKISSAMLIKGIALTYLCLTLMLFVLANYKLDINLIKKEPPKFKKILLWTTLFRDRTFGLRLVIQYKNYI